MTRTTFALIVSSVLLNAAAQLLLKVGVSPLGELHASWRDWPETSLRVLSQWPILLGLSCYVVSVAVWIFGLSRVDVSVAYPMLSIGYVVNALGAWWLLGEALGPARLAGLTLILGGVWLLTRG